MPFFLPLCTFSPSLPNPQYFVLSLSLSLFHLFPYYVLPALISHKKCMMFEYDYHCLSDNKSLQMHLLFHLSPLNPIQSNSSRDSILCKEWSPVQPPLNGETIIGPLDKCFFSETGVQYEQNKVTRKTEKVRFIMRKEEFSKKRMQY
jgi:hypothetical protein